MKALECDDYNGQVFIDAYPKQWQGFEEKPIASSNGYFNILGVFAGLYLEGPDDVSRKTVAAMLVNSLDVPLMKQSGFGANTEYIVMDGKNGVELETFRTILEAK